MTDVLGMKTFSVVIADDDRNICEALGALLSDDPRFALLGVAHSGEDVARLAGTTHADLAIVDVQMPMGGAAAIVAIHAASPTTRVAVYTANRGTRLHGEMLAAGAAGVFHKGDALDLSSALVDLLGD